MATFQAIAIAGQALIGLFEDACPRSEFPNAQFELYRADDFTAPMDEGISLYLYRVAMNAQRRNLPPKSLPDGRRLKPGLPVDLYYMLTPWAKTAAQQHRLLGWAMRVLEDMPSLPAAFLNRYSAEPETFHPTETLEIVNEPLTVNDVNNIWNGFKPNMYPSVAYVARLVTLESTVSMETFGNIQTREFDLAKG
jgi:Pvc16 N-terminal domain